MNINEIINTSGAYTEIPEFSPSGVYSGIKAITYDGADIGGKKTKVFAYLGFPPRTDERGATPGVVLIHGGGGHAFLPWVKLWNDRGYAAIAMENTGFFPTARNAGDTETSNSWARELSGVFEQDGYTVAPDCDGMSASRKRPDAQWMYHAVVQAVAANSILRSHKSVDPDKIGITGISWGGVVASIVIGYDDRLAFAVPIYGSGYLDEAYSWIRDSFATASARRLWSAADRFDRVNMPVLWLCWNDDNCFSVNAPSKSYLATVKNNPATVFSAKNLMMHSHSAGWGAEESYVFANSVTRAGFGLSAFLSQPSGRVISCDFTKDEAAEVTAVLYYILSPMSYSVRTKYGCRSTFMDQTWQTASLTVSGCTVSGSVPPEAWAYYIELTTVVHGRPYITCSAYTVADERT